MSNGTSLSFLVYMIYNESIWKCKGEESGYMEKTMEKIRTMMNGEASEKQYRVRSCRYTDLVMILVIVVALQCLTRLEYAGERFIQSRNGYKIAGSLCAQAATPNETAMNVTIPTADAGKDDSRNTKLPAAEEMNTSALEGGAEILKTEKSAGAAPVVADTTAAGSAAESSEEDRGSTEEQQGEMLELGGFIIGENGLIERCENPSLVVEDGIIILPSDDRCKGIRAEAFTGITGVEEIYIPANITWIEPGALEKLENLMYIEVAPDNPAYQSIDGVLYSKKEQKEKA